MSHKSEKMRKMSQHKAKSAEAPPQQNPIMAHPLLELPPLFCPWGAGINFKHRRAALSVIHRPLRALGSGVLELIRRGAEPQGV